MARRRPSNAAQNARESTPDTPGSGSHPVGRRRLRRARGARRGDSVGSRVELRHDRIGWTDYSPGGKQCARHTRTPDRRGHPPFCSDTQEGNLSDECAGVPIALVAGNPASGRRMEAIAQVPATPTSGRHPRRMDRQRRPPGFGLTATVATLLVALSCGPTVLVAAIDRPASATVAAWHPISDR